MSVEQKRPILVYVTDDERVAFQALADLEGRSLSQQGRRAIQAALAAYPPR